MLWNLTLEIGFRGAVFGVGWPGGCVMVRKFAMSQLLFDRGSRRRGLGKKAQAFDERGRRLGVTLLLEQDPA